MKFLKLGCFKEQRYKLNASNQKNPAPSERDLLLFMSRLKPQRQIPHHREPCHRDETDLVVAVVVGVAAAFVEG